MVSSEKVRLTQLLRKVHFFDLTRPGRLSRTAFWCAFLAHFLFLAVLFIVPFETAYRLQMEPDSDFSGWWLWLLVVPCLGWLAVTVLLLLPSAPFPNRFDRFAEPEERRKQQH